MIKESLTSSWVNYIHCNVLIHYKRVEDTTPCFLGILMQMEANPDDDDVVTIEIMTDVQLILAVLCETDMHRKVKSKHAMLCDSHLEFLKNNTTTKTNVL